MKQGWIIFFDIGPIRYYFKRFYDGIDRVVFDKSQFFVCNDILDANDKLIKILNTIKVCPPPMVKDVSQIKLKVAFAEINEEK